MKNKKKNRNKKKEKIIPVVSKPMPGEIDLDKLTNKQYNDLLEECPRKSFVSAFCDYGVPSFKGEIIKIKGQKGQKHYLFKRIYLEWDYGCDILEGKEDHVWILDAKPFEDANIKVGDKIFFWGDIYFYKKRDGTRNAGIKNVEIIEKLDDYELPSDEELTRQAVKMVICEVCPHNEQCSGMCIENYFF